MKPGMNLDGKVARKIFKCKTLSTPCTIMCSCRDSDHSYDLDRTVKRYSEYPQYSDEILYFMDCHSWQIYCERAHSPTCTFFIWNSKKSKMDSYSAEGVSISHAICLAALKVVKKRAT